METILVTGGAGFIGSCFVRQCIAEQTCRVVNLDKLTYAGNLDSLQSVENDPRYVFVHGDIADRATVDRVIAEHRPAAIVHFAAESHVDRSIDGPAAFVRTNVQGTFQLLDAARRYVARLPAERRAGFRFLHVSTDEVYGSLGPDRPVHRDAAPTIPVRPIRRRRRRPTISPGPTSAPSACRCW